MQLIDLVSVLLINEVKGVPTPKPKEYQAYAFPEMYALSKKGTIRVYNILVWNHGSYTELITKKKTTINGKWVEDIGDVTFRHNFTGLTGSLDHCAAFGLSVVSCGVVNDGFMMSDHLPLVIDIKRQT